MIEDAYWDALLSNKLPLLKLPKTGKMLHFASFSNIITGSDGLIIGSVKDSVKKAIEAGDYVVPVTARPAFNTANLSEELGLKSWVAYGGGTVCLNGEIISDNLINPEVVRVAFDLARKNGMNLIGDVDGIVSSYDTMNMFARYEAALFQQTDPILNFNVNDNHRKIILTVPNDFRKQITNFPSIIKSELVRVLGNNLRFEINNLFIAVTHASCYIEITAAHKSYGVNMIRDRLGVPFECTTGTGYSGDDVDLWKSVAYPIAMNFTPSIFSKDAIFKTSSFSEVIEKLSL